MVSLQNSKKSISGNLLWIIERNSEGLGEIRSIKAMMGSCEDFIGSTEDFISTGSTEDFISSGKDS